MRHLFACSLPIAFTVAVAGACGGGDSETATGGSGGAGATTGASSTTGTTAATSTGAGGSSTGTSSGGGDNADIPGGGTVLLEERFDDASFDARGWYDGAAGTIDAAEHAPGSASSFQCAFQPGGTACAAGKPARHKLTPSSSMYMGFWIKFSPGWVGSGLPYHPHMLHFLTDEDTDWVGPAHTFLTTYTEIVGGRAMLALQDSKNVDLACILQNDDSFVGCNGDFATYPFTEARSACACNGLDGDLDGRDCFPNGDGTWYSSRAWRTPGQVFVDGAGPNDQTAWHFVEVYFELNSIQNGVGVPDGKIRWVQDGQTLIKYDQVLMRTGAHPSMQFNQLAFLPYIGDGSPIAQSFWIDDLVVATAKP